MADILHIACPGCSTLNRIPVGRLGDTPKCGQCHQTLFNGHPVELTAANFQRQIAQQDLPVLVDFWAPWCGPCQMMAPQFVEAARELEPRVRLAKLDTEVAPQLATQFGIRSIPTLILFKSGREVARQSGALAKPQIVSWALNHL